MGDELSIIEPPREIQATVWRECVAALRAGRSLEEYAQLLKELVPEATDVEFCDSPSGAGHAIRVSFGQKWSRFSMMLDALKEEASA